MLHGGVGHSCRGLVHYTSEAHGIAQNEMCLQGGVGALRSVEQIHSEITALISNIEPACHPKDMLALFTEHHVIWDMCHFGSRPKVFELLYEVRFASHVLWLL